MNGQISIFDFPECLPDQKVVRTMNDYWHAEAMGQPFRFESHEELKVAQDSLAENFDLNWWFYVSENKCHGCFPLLKKTKHQFKPLSYAECIACGTRTEPIDDYSWSETKKRWDIIFSEKVKEGTEE